LARGIADDVLSRVQQATDIRDLIGETVALRRRGKKLWGLCPFHGEKTPSFSVDPDRQLFYCFGCRVGGNAFTYLMKRDGLTFPEAVRLLADRAGIVVETVGGDGRSARRATLLAVLADAQHHFRQNLLDPRAGTKGRELLDIRGVTEDARQRFGLGWAPDSWDNLLTALLARGHSRDLIVEAGLAVEGERGPYDRMRARVTFPISDPEGRVVGFGGRALGDAEPKYLNSPETPVYHKGRILYGAHLARTRWRQVPPVLVEGYLDAVACHEAGVTEAVASLGTGLTGDHARFLARHANRVILAYDRDAAGVGAAERAFAILAQEGLTVFQVDFEGAKDLDDLLQADGPDAVREVVAAAVPYLAWRIRRDEPAVRLQPEAKAAAWRQVRPLLAAVSDAVERQEYAHLLERHWGMDPRILAQADRLSQESDRHKSQNSRHNMVRRQGKIGRLDDDGELLSLLLHFPEQVEGVLASFPELWMDTRWKAVLQIWPHYTEEPLAQWTLRLPDELQAWVVGAAEAETVAPPKAAVEMAARMRERRDLKRWQELQARAAGGPLDRELAEEIRELWTRIREQKQGPRREGS
jgi:DNA primase